MTIRKVLPSGRLRRAGFLALLVASGPSIVLGQGGPPACTDQQTVFDPTGTVQQYVVPPGVHTLTIDAAGAQGGPALAFGVVPGNPGGNGARLVASFPVVPGETLRVVVGETGGSAFVNAAGGGGGSFVYRSPDLAGLLIAAAGGGGGSSGSPGVPGSASTTASNGEANGVGVTAGTAGTGGNGGGAGASGGGCAGGGGGGLLTDGGDDPGCGGTGGSSVANGSAGGGGAAASGGFGGGGSGDTSDFGNGSGGGGGFNGGGGGAGPGVIQLGPASGGGGGSFSATTPAFSATGLQTGNGAVSFCFAQTPLEVPSVNESGLVLLCTALAALGAWILHQR